MSCWAGKQIREWWSGRGQSGSRTLTVIQTRDCITEFSQNIIILYILWENQFVQFIRYRHAYSKKASAVTSNSTSIDPLLDYEFYFEDNFRPTLSLLVSHSGHKGLRSRVEVNIGNANGWRSRAIFDLKCTAWLVANKQLIK